MQVRIFINRHLKIGKLKFDGISNNILSLTDTGEFAPKWTRIFSTRRWVILVARTRRKKRKKYWRLLWCKFACGQVSGPRLYRLLNWRGSIRVRFRTCVRIRVRFKVKVLNKLIWKVTSLRQWLNFYKFSLFNTTFLNLGHSNLG